MSAPEIIAKKKDREYAIAKKDIIKSDIKMEPSLTDF
jgi:hypothetical protein